MFLLSAERAESKKDSAVLLYGTERFPFAGVSAAKGK
jgi:hypothetical protein